MPEKREGVNYIGKHNSFTGWLHHVVIKYLNKTQKNPRKVLKFIIKNLVMKLTWKKEKKRPISSTNLPFRKQLQEDDDNHNLNNSNANLADSFRDQGNKLAEVLLYSLPLPLSLSPSLPSLSILHLCANLRI